MAVFIHHIETAVPETAYEQTFIRDVMKAHLGSERKVERLIHRVYAQSGIHKRHSVIRDFSERAPAGLFYDGAQGRLKAPTTGERNGLYSAASRPLYSCLARKAVAHCPGVAAADITHVITVSCTGFFAPGPDYFIVRDLGLSPATQRFHLGFMGCYAAFPALNMARAFCEADPEATVLVVCLELCTLHLQLTQNLDAIIATSVFADGGAVAVVSARSPQEPERALKVERLATTLTPRGEEDMAWTIGDSGFTMVLSSYVPEILGASIAGVLEPLLEGGGLGDNIALGDIDHWAVHPGGRSILDKVQKSLALTDADLAPSRKTLQDYGNMSSATILFVLREVMDKPPVGGDETLCAMAFGPGLTVESGLFSKNPR
ncbi:MAG: type III polyketide synthase [Deinococcota bacterium]|nr:type III polyketide synthase [Deinococcota bacterium]